MIFQINLQIILKNLKMVTSVMNFDNNNIKISITGSNFTYKFLFDSIINEHTGDAYDLAISSKISRKN